MLPRFPACRLGTHKAREDGPHQAPMRRGVVGDDVQFPPGVATNFGFPQEASPFIQAKLPAPMKFEGKKSRCVSFVGQDSDGFRGAKGTTKTKDQAIQAAAAWCWSWWQSLDEAAKSGIQESANSTKKRKVEGDEAAAGAGSSSSKKGKKT